MAPSGEGAMGELPAVESVVPAPAAKPAKLAKPANRTLLSAPATVAVLDEAGNDGKHYVSVYSLLCRLVCDILLSVLTNPMFAPKFFDEPPFTPSCSKTLNCFCLVFFLTADVSTANLVKLVLLNSSTTSNAQDRKLFF